MFTVEVSCSCVLDCIHECKLGQTLETPVSIIQSTAAALGFTVIHVLAKSGLHSEAGGDIIGESKLICLKRIFYKHFNLSQKSKVRPNCVCVPLWVLWALETISMFRLCAACTESLFNIEWYFSWRTGFDTEVSHMFRHHENTLASLYVVNCETRFQFCSTITMILHGHNLKKTWSWRLVKNFIMFQKRVSSKQAFVWENDMKFKLF